MFYNQVSKQEHQLYYAMFARSYDASCNVSNNKNIIHLISSVYKSPTDLDLTELCKFFPESSSILSDSGQFIVLRICNYPILGSDGKEIIQVHTHSEYFIEYRINLYYWLTYLWFDYNQIVPNYSSLSSVVLGLFNKESNESFDSHINHTLFIYDCKGLSWSSIKYLHSIFGVKISGGNSSRRHVLSSVHYNLSKVLVFLNVPSSSVYKNFSDFMKIDRSLVDSKSSLVKILTLVHNKYRLPILYQICDFILNSLISYFNNNKELDDKLKSLQGSKSSLSDKLESLKSNKKSDYNSKKLIKLTHDISELNNLINDINIKINYKKTELVLLQKELDSLSNCNYDELINIYNNRILSFPNHIELIDSSINYIKVRSRKFNKFNVNNKSNKRYFSCYSTNVSHKNNYQLLIKSNFNQRSFSCLSGSVFTKTNKFYILSLPLGNRYYSSKYTNRINFNINSLAYIDIMKIINSDLDISVKQISIEEYLYNVNKNLYINSNSIEKNLDYNIVTSDVAKILLSTEEDLSKLIKNFISRNNLFDQKGYNIIRKIYETLGCEYLIKISWGRVLKILSYKNTHNKDIYFTFILEDLSTDILNHFNFIEYKKHLISQGIIKENIEDKYVPYGFSNWKNSNPNLILDLTNNQEVLFQLGNELITNLSVTKLITSKLIINNYDEKRRILVPGSKFNSIKLDKINYLDFSKHIPMLVTPNKYELVNNEITGGGYLLNDKYYTNSLISKKYNLAHESKVLDNNTIINMVNNINSVEFKINSEVFYFICNNRKKFSLLIDPDEESPYKNKSKLKLKEEKEMISFYSKKNLEQNILGLANIFVTLDKFYLPVKLDYRGRINCISELITYQGSELSKSLLQFANGSKIYLNDQNAINYLKIYGVNCFGNKLNKTSFFNRIAWVNENEKDIIDFTNGNLINKAETKLLFIAFCFEYRKYIQALNNKVEYFISNLPIQLDASCNGYQHLALLIQDNKLAELLNLKASNWSDIPDDFYSFIALQLKEYFTKEVNLINSTNDKIKLDSYKKLAELKLTEHRNLIKKSIMCIPYNLTIYSMIDYLKAELNQIDKDNFVLKKDTNIILNYKDIINIATGIFKIIFRDFPKLNNLMKYFKQVTKISNTLNIPIPWTLPTGMIIKQQFFDTKEVKFKPFSYSKEILKIEIINNKRFNARKQTLALMPNIIHSLDAASLGMVIDYFFKESLTKNFYSIHDCFAVTCDKVSILSDVLKHSYIKLYLDSKYLEIFDRKFKEQLRDILGEDYIKTSPKNNKKYIEVIGLNDKVIKLDFPDVKAIIEPTINIIDIKDSSYLIH